MQAEGLELSKVRWVVGLEIKILLQVKGLASYIRLWTLAQF